MKIWLRALGALVVMLALLVALVAWFLSWEGSERGPGEIVGNARPKADVRRAEFEQDVARLSVARRAGGPRPLPSKRILFGDLHVHTTFSPDAFFMSLPIVAGEGAHPPADACDFARHCSALDFFAITDHALGMTRARWDAEKESLRQCQARSGDPDDPDIVAFAGWEWTQIGTGSDDHWGHKNVIFPDLDDDALPARVINSLRDEDLGVAQSRGAQGVGAVRGLSLVDPFGWREYADFRWYVNSLVGQEVCPKGVDTRELPPDCVENAPDPAVLFEKLGQWGFDTLVIPHGTTWGLYTPPGTSLDKQLTRAQHDPRVQSMVEVMSGHGNSEEYRSFRAVEADGSCPEPSDDYLPCCWRAGELMRERCGDLDPAECERRVALARQYALDAGAAPHLVFPDTTAEDWLDCGQCRDCFKPSLGYRPMESAQYALSRSNFDEPGDDGDPLRFRWSFIASSDVHTARPGTGYKQYDRRRMTEAKGARSRFYDRVLRRAQTGQLGDWEPDMPVEVPRAAGGRVLGADTERVASFLYPGGLAAVHAASRSREDVWAALQRGEVYGTSGPRILLWFDLLNGADGAQPMGSEVELAANPRFEVRAVGAFVQQDGCPESSLSALPSERLAYLCRGQCYHPGDARHRITHVEVVRIRPQARPGEPVEDLIEDPWQRFECDPDPVGCVVQFEDPDFLGGGRDAVYYVRAIQEETPAVNAANLRTEFDAEGNPVSTDPCYGDYRTDFDDDCLAPARERAWSSPIFVDRARSREGGLPARPVR